MPYHPTIPQATDDPSNSQADILDNFGKINADFSINHVPLTSGGNQGQHTKIFIANPLAFTADPNLVPNQSSLYVKTAALGTNELFFQNGNLPNPSTYIPTTGLNVRQLTNLPIVNGIITNVVQSVGNALITSPNHGLILNNHVTISGVYGAIQLSGTYVVNGVVDANNFTVAQAGLGVYVAGTGFWTTSDGATMLRYGFITPWNLVVNLGTSNASPVNYAIPFNSARYAAFIQTLNGFISSTVATTVTDLVTLTYAVNAPGPVYYLVIGK